LIASCWTYELKRDYQKWLHHRDKDRDDADGRPDREPAEIEEWAREHGLQTVIHDEFESPLHLHTVEELTWYFEQRRALPDAGLGRAHERFVRAADVFERPRFYPVYRQWLKTGDRAFEDVSSAAISDALASGAARVESLVLLHQYDHLSPVVDSVGPATRGAEKGAEESHQRGEHTPARSRPPFAPSEVDAINSAAVDSEAADASSTP
jgi:hypothetical protein